MGIVKGSHRVFVSTHPLRKLLRNWVFNSAGTLFGFAVVFATLRATNLEPSAETATAILLAVGGLITTALVLLISLSIIPLQRASEDFTPAVVALYRHDWLTNIVLIIVIVFAISSFALAIHTPQQIQIEFVLFAELLKLSATFDLLRWYQRQTGKLLQPANAITSLLRLMQKAISRSHRRIERMAKLSFFLEGLVSASKRTSVADVMTMAYAVSDVAKNQSSGWAQNVGALTMSAIAKKQNFAALEGVRALQEATTGYFLTREKTLLMQPAGDPIGLVYETNGDEFLTNVFEELRKVMASASVEKNEVLAAEVFRSTANITACLLALRSPYFPEHVFAPNSWRGIGYFDSYMKLAMQHRLLDPLLTASHELQSLVSGSDMRIDRTSLHDSVIDLQFQLAYYFLASGDTAIAETPCQGICSVYFDAYNKSHHEADFIIENCLEKFESLIPLNLSLEGAGTLQFGAPPPVRAPYDLTYEASLATLVRLEIEKVEPDEERNWVNPYSKFLELIERIHRHLRNVAENVDFGTSFLLWHIIQTIRVIGDILIAAIRNPVRDGFEDELVNRLMWLISFFSYVFYEKSSISDQHIKAASNCLGRFALALYRQGRHAETIEIVDIIISIGRYWQSSMGDRPHVHADILINIRGIQMVAERAQDQILIDKCAEYAEMDPSWPQDYQARLADALSNRKEQFEERVQGKDRYRLRDSDLPSFVREYLED